MTDEQQQTADIPLPGERPGPGGGVASDAAPIHGDRFATTRWSVVRASASPEGVRFREAMEELTRMYRSAIRSYIGSYHPDPPDEVEDLTQDFLLRWFVQGMPRVDAE